MKRSLYLTCICLWAYGEYGLAGSIATDGSVGPRQTLAGPNFGIPETLGTRAGNNLFHSFTRFSLDSRESATFTGSASIQNVISRVTGGQVSNINGTLRSQVGSANVYFVNPAGVVFGPNAQIDVPAAFHASTADEMKFRDGSRYSATQPNTSRLTSATPSAFGFLAGSTANNGLLKVEGARLAVKEKQTLDLNGRGITIENSGKNSGIVLAPAGEVRLVGAGNGIDVPLQPAKGNVLPLPKELPNQSNAASIRIENSSLSSNGNGVGRIGLWGNNLAVKGSSAIAFNSGAANAKAQQGIEVQVHSLVSDNSNFATIGDSGRAGDITINASDSVNVVNGGGVFSITSGSGNAGNIRMHAGNFRISGQGSTTPTIIQSQSVNTGRSGTIDIFVDGLVEVLNNALILSKTSGSGNGGNVQLKAGQLRLSGGASDKATIAADTIGNGRAGNIDINVKDSVEVFHGGIISSRSAAGTGKGGDIRLQASQLRVAAGNNPNFAGITTQTNSSNRAGNIDINIRGLAEVLDGGQITSSTFDRGAAGDIQMRVGQLRVIGGVNFGSLIGANTQSSGKAGRVDISVNGLAELINGGEISSGTFGSGDAGSIRVQSSQLRIVGGTNPNFTGIASQANEGSIGNAGTVEVTTLGSAELRDRGEISTSTFGAGNAGNLQVQSHDLHLDGQSTLISSEVRPGSRGLSGNINVQAADQLSLSNGARISIRNDGKAVPSAATQISTLKIDAPRVTLQNKSFISSTSSGNVAASNIFVNYAENLLAIDSGITTQSANGNGGQITTGSANANTFLKNSTITSSVFGATGNGGNIANSSKVLVLDNASIKANTEAKGALAGNIDLTQVQAIQGSGNQLLIQGKTADGVLFPGGNNIIEATAANGVNGVIQADAAQLYLSGVFANLGTPQFDTSALTQDVCNIGQTSSLTRKGNGALRPKQGSLRRI